jgi:hypothetical protein
VYAKLFQFGLHVAGACLVFASVSGCSIMRVYLGPDLRTPGPPAELTGIVYRLDAAPLNESLAVARIEGQTVSYDEVAASRLTDRTVGTLRIIYPHPEAPPELARAEVQIDAAPLPDLAHLNERSSELLPWYRHGMQPTHETAEASHETWQLDLPRAEMEQLLGRLATPHVVVSEGNKQSGANLKTSFNGHHYQANCQPVPELDALMQRIRRDGRLVSYTRPLTARAQRLEQTSAVLAYREMHLHSGGIPTDSYAAMPQEMLPGLARSGLASPWADAPNRMAFVPSTDSASEHR